MKRMNPRLKRIVRGEEDENVMFHKIFYLPGVWKTDQFRLTHKVTMRNHKVFYAPDSRINTVGWKRRRVYGIYRLKKLACEVAKYARTKGWM